MKDDRVYLLHILECIQRIENYIHPGRDAFIQDTKTQDAVLRNLHTLTESTQKLSDKLKASCPEVDWRAISGFRNVVVHDYLGVDIDQIWHIVTVDLPVLVKHIEKLLHP